MKPAAVLRSLLLLFVAAGCAAQPSPPAPGLLALPERRADLLCAGWGLIGDFTLEGSAEDRHLAWLNMPGGERQELVWPAGYWATFTPDLVVLDSQLRVVAAQGSHPSGACPMGDEGEWYAEFR